MDTLRDDFKATGVKAIVTNSNNGGSGGTTFTLTNKKVAASKVSVWIAKGSGDWSDRDLVKAIKVTWTDGDEQSTGNKTGNEHSFEFHDGETVTEMKFWTGARVDKLSLTTSGNRTFAHGGTGGTEHKQDIGNGVLLGFQGTADTNELISLGSKFKEDSD